MGMSRLVPLLVLGGLVILSRVLERRGLQRHGTVLGIPYDLRPPTMERVRQSFWDPGDPRVLKPHAFGVGYSINFGAVAKRIGLAS